MAVMRGLFGLFRLLEALDLLVADLSIVVEVLPRHLRGETVSPRKGSWMIPHKRCTTPYTKAMKPVNIRSLTFS